jgi:hypothetical protein
VVLVEPSSASASEIVAGALQDHDRALVIGPDDVRQGLGADAVPAAGNNWLKITTARWYTPVGRSIQKPYGIDAPHPLDWGRVAGAAARTRRTGRSTARTAGGSCTAAAASGRTWCGAGHADAEERPFRCRRAAAAPAVPSAKLAFAVRYLRQNPSLQPGFEVTDAMLDASYGALTAADVEVDRARVRCGGRWVAMESVRDHVLEVGRAGGAAAQNADDPQVVRRRSAAARDDPESLFTLATAYDAARRPSRRAAPGCRHRAAGAGATGADDGRGAGGAGGRRPRRRVSGRSGRNWRRGTHRTLPLFLLRPWHLERRGHAAPALHATVAHATSLFIIVPTAVVGTLTYAKAGLVAWRAAAAHRGVLGARRGTGALLAARVPQELLKVGSACSCCSRRCNS